MPGHVLGIDIGTGGTRALILRADGRIVASATEEHEPFASLNIGWAEQHPEDWWRAAGIAVRKALAQSGLASEEIACAGFSGQMHGAVMLDSNGDVVRPALIWCDVRTGPQCEELNRKIGAERLIQVAVDSIDHELTVVVGGGDIQVWHIVKAARLVLGAVHEKLQGFAFDMVGEERQGVIDGLQEDAVVRIGDELIEAQRLFTGHNADVGHADNGQPVPAFGAHGTA